MEAVTKDKVVEDLRSVTHDVQELVKGTANEAGERIGAVRARAKASLHGAQARLVEVGQEIANRARGTARATDRYLHDRPWQALGVAGGIGLIIGYMLGRR